MANKKNFINPLTRSSEEELHISKPSTDTSTYTENQEQKPPTLSEFQPLRKRGNQAFEKTHQRFTGWIDKNLKQQFEKLAENNGVSKTSLLNEAIADLLRKYMQK
jgi:hypothetical protein